MEEDLPESRTDSAERMKRQHQQYFFVMDSPIRRQILEELRTKSSTVEELSSKTGVPKQSLEWHLSQLEAVKCVQKTIDQNNATYKLTKFGERAASQ